MWEQAIRNWLDRIVQCVPSVRTKSKLAKTWHSAWSFWHVQYIKFHFLCPRFAFYHLFTVLVLFLGHFSYLVSRLSYLVSCFITCQITLRISYRLNKIVEPEDIVIKWSNHVAEQTEETRVSSIKSLITGTVYQNISSMKEVWEGPKAERLLSNFKTSRFEELLEGLCWS